MTVIGIIAEYNPLHNGHIWHIEQTRHLFDCYTPVVAVLSGSVVQRGEAAIFPKHKRAQAVLQKGGVNLVLELPAPYALSSAQTFAQAGVRLLEATGVVTHLSFGSECGALPFLETMQKALHAASPKPWLQKGLPFPLARQKAAEAYVGYPCPDLSGRNNILAIEYLAACKHLTPLTVPRNTADTLRTATQLRTMLRTGEDVSSFMPVMDDDSLSYPMTLQDAPVLDHVRRLTPADWTRYADVSEGLENRLYAAAGQAVSLEDLYARVKTKRYTMARIRRIVLRAYLDIPQKHTDVPPAYLRVLAFDETGASLLRQMRKTAALPVITKPAAFKDALALEAQVTDRLALHHNPPWPRGMEWLAGPVRL